MVIALKDRTIVEYTDREAIEQLFSLIDFVGPMLMFELIVWQNIDVFNQVNSVLISDDFPLFLHEGILRILLRLFWTQPFD